MDIHVDMFTVYSDVVAEADDPMALVRDVNSSHIQASS